MMGLRELLADNGAPDIAVAGMTLDSRLIRPGDAFVAVPGTKADGREFIQEALERGACAVLADSRWHSEVADHRVILIEGLKDRLGALADRFYRSPSKDLKLLSVTGTNGKTSVVELTAQLLRTTGRKAGVVGTLGMRLDEAPTEAVNTTPHCIALHQQLRVWLDQSVRWVAMEASSHALDQGRLDGLAIDAAVFTNLSRDHLDYHVTLDAYFAAKVKLFQDFAPGVQLFNADDEFLSRHSAVWGENALGISCEGLSTAVQVSVTAVSPLAFDLRTPWGVAQIKCPLSGRFNAFNLTAAICLLAASGISFSEVIGAAEQVMPVVGRMQKLQHAADVSVVIDYAHTPDALERALSTLSEGGVTGQIWVLFGCGGDRDRGKRAEMGSVAARLADCLVVTSDNPRTESPDAIIEDIIAGCEHAPLLVEPDRAAAIGLAISRAAAGDIVLIAGKGHEAYQEIDGKRHPFSDEAHALKQLDLRLAA